MQIHFLKEEKTPKSCEMTSLINSFQLTFKRYTKWEENRSVQDAQTSFLF